MPTNPFLPHTGPFLEVGSPFVNTADDFELVLANDNFRLVLGRVAPKILNKNKKGLFRRVSNTWNKKKSIKFIKQKNHSNFLGFTKLALDKLSQK